MTNREAFLKAALSKMGMPYMWDGKGPTAFDCSGLVTAALFEAGGPDLRSTWNTQRMWDDLPSPSMLLGAPGQPGDLCLYGNGNGTIWHVMILLGVGQLVFGSAGGDSTTTSIAKALTIGAKVQLWETKDYMQGFCGFRRIPWVGQ